jgi:OHCU decarboxylase
MTLAELNALPASLAEKEFARCCGSTRWARLMTHERPFTTVDVIVAVAQRLWWSLEAADWLEAFAAHPRIGERATSAWSAEEQAAATTASDHVHTAMARQNQEYERRFGYTFVVSAMGKSADDILTILERRLLNEPMDELQIAADQQREIVGLRLRRLLTT